MAVRVRGGQQERRGETELGWGGEGIGWMDGWRDGCRGVGGWFGSDDRCEGCVV